MPSLSTGFRIHDAGFPASLKLPGSAQGRRASGCTDSKDSRMTKTGFPIKTFENDRKGRRFFGRFTPSE